ncbi:MULTISPECIES: GCG_CRPN prefix-to-repeats domain-containing protein [unclassified Sinorhizobium]|uniref:GCG_CRPN prefix-to-repeats domain-containing protein n=1 Tax=unclassified Sinorhizobium TaxID=2613772 RepID=UPI003524F4DC
MRMMIIAAALIGGFVATNANAMPIAPVNVQSQVIKVDYECGRGWHLTRWGECRPNRWDRRPPPRYSWHRPPPPRWAWDGPRWRDRERGYYDGYRY